MTVEVLNPGILGAGEARELTDRIKMSLEVTWQVVAFAYSARVWLALEVINRGNSKAKKLPPWWAT